jgi:sulfide:quinone oxidoreductase
MTSPDRARVLVAGGGFAALEACLALRALAGARVDLMLVAPEPVFAYRPAATSEPFDVGPPLRYDLREIADDLGADYQESRLEAVASRKQFARTTSGARLRYDCLIVATGARPEIGVSGAMTFRDQRDVHLIRRLLDEVESGAARRVVFSLPSGCVWPLPIYELALLSAHHARERGAELDCTLVSAERAPLELLGSAASGAVSGLLAEGGVRFVGAVAASHVRRDGRLVLADGETIEADRVVAVPQLRGRRITGVPARPSGFVPVDALGRVEGLHDVYAAGDVTTFPIKQGGLATQQADLVAHLIAAGLGAPVREVRPAPVLQVQLLSGARTVCLRVELDWRGQPTSMVLERPRDHEVVKTGKVAGRYLVPYLETREPLTHDRLAPRA